MGRFYTERLQDLPGIILPLEKTDSAENIYWVYGIVLERESEVSNQEIQKMLAEEGIGSRTFFWCMHEQPVYQRQGLFAGERYEGAEYLARKGFYIPSGLALTKEQMEEVADKVRKVIQNIQ